MAITLLRALALAVLGICLAPCADADPSGPLTWGETTHMADAGWGRMTFLKNGCWLGVNALYPKPNSILQLEISGDKARTWTFLATVAEPGRNLDNGEVIQLPNGDLLLTGRSVVDGPGQPRSYHLPVYRSADGGKTWAFQSQIDTNEAPPKQPGQPSVGLWEPHFFFLPDGRLACAYADEKPAVATPAYSQIVLERVSPDGGKTWGREIVLAAQVGGGGQRPGMPVLSRMKNGQYMAVYEVVGVGDADVYFKTSRDGVTWPPGIGVRIPCQHAGPWVTTLASGRLVVTSCENQISTSDDDGATWLLATPPAWPIGHVLTWPAVYQTAPDTLAAMNTYHGVQIRWGKIMPVRPWPAAFLSDFTTGTDAGWTRYGGQYGFSDGSYLLNNAGTTGKSLTGDPAWHDGILEADVMLTSAGNAGLLFRTTNADLAGPDAFSGYYIGLDSTGSVFLSRSVNDYTELARAPLDVPLNTWQHLKVVLHGATIAVYVGNSKTPTLRVSDSFFLRGQIGVRAHNCNATFRRVRYQGPAPKPPTALSPVQSERLTCQSAPRTAAPTRPLPPAPIEFPAASSKCGSRASDRPQLGPPARRPRPHPTRRPRPSSPDRP